VAHAPIGEELLLMGGGYRVGDRRELDGPVLNGLTLPLDDNRNLAPPSGQGRRY
jgi:hypothetical protein